MAAEIFLCPVDTPRALSAAKLSSHLPPGAPPHQVFDSFGQAYAAAAGRDPILVAGSLFLNGEARALLTKGSFRPSSQ